MSDSGTSWIVGCQTSSVHGILQPRMLELVTMPFSRVLPNSRIQRAFLMAPALAGGFLTTSATWKAFIFYGTIE